MRIAIANRAALALAAAGVLAAGVPAEAKKSVRISLVLPATGTQFGDRLRYGAEAAAKTFGGAVQLKVTGPAQIDPSQEVSIFQNEASTNPDAIIVGPIPASLFVEPALQAQEQGIKVAWIVVPPAADIKEGLFVGNNEYEMGQKVGDLLVDRIITAKGQNASGTVVPGICIPGLTNLEDRLAGVKDSLGKRLPAVKIANEVDTGNERGQNYAAWDQAIQANPQGLSFYDACEPGMINLTKLKEDDKLTFPLLVWDTPDEVLAGVTHGLVANAVPPSHFISGYLATYVVAKALLEDKPIPTGWLRTPTQVIDSSNIDAFTKAESSAAGKHSYFKPAIDKLTASMPAQLPPLADSHR